MRTGIANRAGKMAQLVKPWLCKPRDLSSVSGNHVKKYNNIQHWEVSLLLAGQPAQACLSPSRPVRGLSQKAR